MLLTSDDSAWLAVFGRFHIVLLHLPIGLLPGMFVLEFGAALIRRPNPRGAVLTLAVLTALAGGAALASGLVLAGEKTDTELLGQHKNVAIAMAIACGLLPIFALLRDRLIFRLGLLLSLTLSVWAGHLGGSLTHKKGFLFKPLERTATSNETKQHDANKPAPLINGADIEATASVFQKQIAPIFKRVCNDCHNEEEAKGDLLLTTKDGILCTDRDIEERVLVPFEPDNSYLLEVCELPIDDEYHMPPEDEDQLTAAELATLRAWIKNGCKFE